MLGRHVGEAGATRISMQVNSGKWAESSSMRFCTFYTLAASHRRRCNRTWLVPCLPPAPHLHEGLHDAPQPRHAAAARNLSGSQRSKGDRQCGAQQRQVSGECRQEQRGGKQVIALA